MRTLLLAIPLAALLSFLPALAGEPPSTNDALLAAVENSTTKLADAVHRTHTSRRTSLRATLTLDTAGQLVARVLLIVREKEGRSFEEWSGPVHSAGWVPRRRVLDQESELAAAERLWMLLEPAPEAIWQALVAAVCPERADRPADVVISAAPAPGEETCIDLVVGAGGGVKGFTFSTKTTDFTPAEVQVPSSVPVEVRRLPALDVPQGRWFNAETAPTLATLRGHPALVLVTSPG